MKEDVLEQIVDDYLKFNGYFTMHNIPFSPRKDHPEYVARSDSVPSDIDIIAVNPSIRAPAKVMVVNCKSWQKGFRAEYILAQLKGERPNPKRPRERQFRELWLPKWNEAFRNEVKRLTGADRFIYRIAVTRLVGPADGWIGDPTIRSHLPRGEFGFLTLEEMWAAMLDGLTTRPAPSEIGRLAQLLKAAQLTAASTDQVSD